MSKGRQKQQSIPVRGGIVARQQVVASLYEAMSEAGDYSSIVDKVPAPNYDLLGDVQKVIKDIEAFRGRPCLSYVGNVVRSDTGGSGIDASDDLPFIEMVRAVPADVREVDMFLATRGGSAQQVVRFVDFLRQRFERVEFLIPSFCMSAGTLFALSGDKIWMTPSACLGPTDPQIRSTSGRLVPAQAMLTLMETLRLQGDESLRKTGGVPWTAVQIVNTMDKRELGEAITATKYSETMAKQFLEKYKFKEWVRTESAGAEVTPEMRSQRAGEVAVALAKHDRWNSHGHSISREVLWGEIQLRIDQPDPELLRLMTRAWALYNYIFDRTNVLKILASGQYRFARWEQAKGAQ